MKINEDIKPHEVDYYIRRCDKNGNDSYYNIATGKKYASKSHFPNRPYKILLTNELHKFADFVYDEKNDVLVVFLLSINTEKNEKTPRILGRYDIKRNKKIICRLHEKIYSTDSRKWEEVQTDKWVDSYIWSGDFENDIYLAPFCHRRRMTFYANLNDNFVREIYKIFPDFAVTFGSYVIRINDFDSLIEFLNFPCLQKNKNKAKQRMVDKLTALPLSAPSSIHRIYSAIDRVNDEWCVIRVFCYGFEALRVYVGKNMVISCKRSSKIDEEEYIYCPLKKILENNIGWKRLDLVVGMQALSFSLDKKDICDVSGTKLSYIIETAMEFSVNHRNRIIVEMLCHSFIEKLAKSWLSCSLIGKINGESNTLESLSYMFIMKLTGNEGIYEGTGFNRYQIKKIAGKTSSENISDVIYDIKYVLQRRSSDSSDIRGIDNTTFDKVFAFFENIWKQYSRDIKVEIRHVLHRVNILFGTKSMLRVIDTMSMFMEMEHSMRWLVTYSDYVRMMGALQVQDGGEEYLSLFNLYCRDVEELKVMHDNIVYCYKKSSYGFDENSFDDKKENWEKYLFSDGDFMLLYPGSPVDVIKEGSCLHHCVESYISPIIEDQTNIFFIRKKDAPDESFYTAEVTKQDVIRQVHGFGNRNAYDEPGLEDFIKKWAEEKNLSIGSYNCVQAADR